MRACTVGVFFYIFLRATPLYCLEDCFDSGPHITEALLFAAVLVKWNEGSDAVEDIVQAKTCTAAKWRTFERGAIQMISMVACKSCRGP